MASNGNSITSTHLDAAAGSPVFGSSGPTIGIARAPRNVFFVLRIRCRGFWARGAARKNDVVAKPALRSLFLAKGPGPGS